MRTDFILDEDLDIQADPETGDFLVGDSAQQEAFLIIDSKPGDWPRTPLVGVNLVNKLKKRTGASPLIENPKRLKREIKVALNNDGLTIAEMTVTNNLSDFELTVYDE